MEVGNKRFIEELTPELGPQIMSAGYCQSNSICVVAEMRDKGEDDWDIVSGFAFNTEKEDPIIHVWVKKGSLHYDPTWSLDYFGYAPEDCTYYQVFQNIESTRWEQEKLTRIGIVQWGKDILNEIKVLAAKWKLKITIAD
jgi:hypothetical protein